MRLREIQKILEDNIGELDVKKVTSGSNSYVENYGKLLNKVINIHKTGIIDTEYAVLEKKGFILPLSTNKFSVTSTTSGELITIIETIRNKVDAVLTLIDGIFPEEEHEFSVVLKMPKTMTIKDYNEIVGGVNTFFTHLSQIYIFKDQDIEVSYYDKGSDILVLLITVSTISKIVMDVVGLVTEKAYAMRQLKRYDREGEAVTRLIEELSATSIQCLKNITTGENSGGGSEEENMNNMIKAVEALMLVVGDKGVQITPSINAPDKIKDSFESKKIVYESIADDIQRIRNADLEKIEEGK